jgi:hypothetical protein
MRGFETLAANFLLVLEAKEDQLFLVGLAHTRVVGRPV